MEVNVLCIIDVTEFHSNFPYFFKIHVHNFYFMKMILWCHYL